jgi:flagellar protein FlaG
MSIQSVTTGSQPIAAGALRSVEASSPSSPPNPPPSAPLVASTRIGVGNPAKTENDTSRSRDDMPPATPDQIQSALQEVRDALAPVARNLRFSIDDDTGRTVIKIIDSSTDQMIRQIPSEEILAIAKALDRLQGLLIKQKA